MVQQQTSEAVVVGSARRRDDAAEERRVPAEPVGVEGGFRVRVGAMIEKPLKDLRLVLVHAEAQKRRAFERRAVNVEIVAVRVMVATLGINLLQRERTVHKIRIGLQMLFEKIDATTMDGHRRRVGEGDAMRGQQLEALVLALRVPAVCPEEHRKRRRSIAEMVAQVSAELDQVR